MEKLVLMIILIMPVAFGTGVSYNQPKLSPYASWNENGTTFANSSVIGTGSIPLTIFVDINNTVYVAARYTNSVFVWLEENATLKRTIFNNWTQPVTVFAATNGSIYVSEDSSNAYVYKLTLNTTNAEITMYPSATCYGLFVDLNDTLYCSIQADHIVVKKLLNSSGNSLLNAAGINNVSGNGTNQLNGPRGIFVDVNFSLYVADQFNNRIQRFMSGQSNGTTVSGNISLNQPSGVVLDADGNLFIADTGNNRIVEFGSNGFRCLVGCSGLNGSSSDDLNLPRTMSFDSYGNIFVADRFHQRIQKFLLSTNHCDSTQPTQSVYATTVTTTWAMEETSSITSTQSIQIKTTMITDNTKITTTETHSTTHLVADPPPLPNFIPPVCNDSFHIGPACNISSAPCDILQPCQNEGICINNKSIPNGYVCQCPSGFNGNECQFDIRPCKPNTCWNNGTCLNKSNSDFLCICAEGWTGIHCETKVNYCQNITCQNNGVCRPLFRDYKCECSSNSYSGRYCEITSNALVARKVVSKSFGYIAIICILIVIGFFVTLDILKYIFGIDPTQDEVKKLQRQKVLKKKKKPVVAIRFKYVNEPSSVSIVNETD